MQVARRTLEPISLWPPASLMIQPGETEGRPRITPYLLDAPVPAACIIVCPGGGYSSLAPHENQVIAQWVNSIGLSAVVLEYRLSPCLWPAMLDDAQRAIRLVRANADRWNIDPRRVGILGFSAGGHLSAAASTMFERPPAIAVDQADRQSCRPDAAVLCYPVTSLATDWRPEMSKRILDPGATEADLVKASPVHHVTPQTTPAFVWHTANDQMVPVRQSIIYAEALARAAVPFALHVWPDGRHGIALTDHPVALKWSAACEDWLREMGFVCP